MSEQENTTTSQSLRSEIVWLLVGIVFTPLYFYVAVLGWTQIAEWYPRVLENVITPVIVMLAALALIQFVRNCYLFALVIRHRSRKDEGSWDIWFVLQLSFALLFFSSFFPAMFALDEVHPRFSEILCLILSPYLAMGILLLQVCYMIWLGYRGFMEGVRRASGR